MQAGLTRVQALRQLTTLASGERIGHLQQRADRGLRDLARRHPGRVHDQAHRVPARLARLHQRAATTAGMVELYDADLSNDTLTRVTQGYEGGPSAHPATNDNSNLEDPYELNAGRRAVAVLLRRRRTARVLLDRVEPRLRRRQHPARRRPRTSTAATSSSTARIIFAATSTPQVISATPPGPAAVPVWELGVDRDLARQRNGRLELTLPGAGTLSAHASAPVKVAVRSGHGRHATVRTRVLDPRGDAHRAGGRAPEQRSRRP